MTDPVVTADAGGDRRRFVAPLRGAVDPACFAHPLLHDVQPWSDLLTDDAWPSIAALDARLALPDKQLVEQDTALLGDGLHYEQRIAEGRIATRTDNWHDLFNALVWARHPAIKRALNAQQCRHIGGMGASRRNRAQAALTQFDESGVIVRVRAGAAGLLPAWGQHAWTTLFVDGAAHWANGRIRVLAVIGHALMEQVLLPGRLLVGKCVVVQGEDDAACLQAVAAAIAEGRLLQDPLQLRPLPLAGIPGWHADQDGAFYQQSGYFRAVREGRVYPPPQCVQENPSSP